MAVTLSAANRLLLEQAVTSAPDGSQSASRPGALPLERLTVIDSTLQLEPATPGKPPIVFHCSRLVLDGITSAGGPITYDADLTAPIPNLHSSGRFGPLNLALLRNTPISGAYQLTAAPLNLLSGIAGSLSSTGTITGTLGHVDIAGSARSPDFALDVSAHPFPATADYRATFDLTSGDIALPLVSVHVLRTTASATGAILRQPAGRSAQLDLHIRNGRNEDLLTLLSRPRPVFLGALSLDTRLDIPAGDATLIRRMKATGAAAVDGVLWTNPAVQQQMDALSMRAENHAEEARAHPGDLPDIHSTLTGQFTLAAADIAITHLVYAMPGATILMDGHFPLIASDMQFHGVARTVATASHMETGVKSLLLKPLSPLLRKNGAGMQLPVSFSGDKADPTLNLDLTHLHRDNIVSRQNPETPRP